MKHITPKQRDVISAYLKGGWKNNKIAEELGIASSTVSREIRRNSGKRGYSPNLAHEMAQERKERFKHSRQFSSAIVYPIHQGLRKEWSLEYDLLENNVSR